MSVVAPWKKRYVIVFLPEKQEPSLFLLQSEREPLDMFSITSSLKSLAAGMALLQNAPFCQLIRLDRLECIHGDVSLQQAESLRS